jgi:hypothetical protein
MGVIDTNNPELPIAAVFLRPQDIFGINPEAIVAAMDWVPSPLESSFGGVR